MDPTKHLALSRDDFHIAVFCALPHEANKVIALFDVDWRKQGVSFGKAPNDSNMYSLGSIGRHNIVVVHIGRMGVNGANAAAATISRSFVNITLAFVVGICGIVPQYNRRDVMLGDCIISTAIVQYDFGSQYPQGYIKKVEVEDILGRASRAVANFLALLRAQAGPSDELSRSFLALQQKVPNLNIEFPSQPDCLFDPNYIHTHHAGGQCSQCIPAAGVCRRSCQELDCDDQHILRKRTGPHPPNVHFGRIGSSNTIMKSGSHRDKLAGSDSLLAFEMEGSGVWDHYPTIVVKSGCDYADSHKNLDWQEHASAVAACGFKTLLEMLEHEDSVPRSPAPPGIFLASASQMAGP